MPSNPALVAAGGQALSSGASEQTRDERLASAFDQWQARVVTAHSNADQGLENRFAEGSEAVVELTSAHPGGIAQLYAGRPTPLVNLLRDPTVRPLARRRTKALLDQVASAVARTGFAPIHLVVGIASWTEPQVPGIASDATEQVSAVEADADGDARDGDGQTTAAVADNLDLAEKNTSNAVVTARPNSAPDERSGAEPRTITTPVLLRPVAVSVPEAVELEYEFTLESTTRVFPQLVEALCNAGAVLDPTRLAGQVDGCDASDPGARRAGFQPSAALDQIEQLGRAHLPDFRLERRSLIASVLTAPAMLASDLPSLRMPSAWNHVLRNDLVAALAGDPIAQAEFAAGELVRRSTADPDPSDDHGIGDLDPSQRCVIAELMEGRSLFVDAPLAENAASMAAAIVAEAAASGRSTLYVSGSRRAAEALIGQLAQHNLADLVLDVAVGANWRQEVSQQLLAALASDPPVEPDPLLAQHRKALRQVRTQLGGYIAALHQKRAPWQVSAYDALQTLAHLTAQRPSPHTKVRVPTTVTVALSVKSRQELSADLAAAMKSAATEPAALDTPWQASTLTTSDAAQHALARVQRVASRILPRLQATVVKTAEATGFEPATSLTEFEAQLQVVRGISDVLDVFKPQVFEADLAALLTATAPRKLREDHELATMQRARRRARKRVEELLRPGVKVADVHAAVQEVQEKLQAWRAYNPSSTTPTLPPDLAKVVQDVNAAQVELTALDGVLPGEVASANLAFPELAARLQVLAADASALDELVTHRSALQRIRLAGLGPLLADLTVRKVPEAEVGAELELCWWASVFEQILATEPHLAQPTGADIDLLARQFRALDRAQLVALLGPLSGAVQAQRAAALRANQVGAASLHAELVATSFETLRDLRLRYPDLISVLRPVVVATPALVPTLVAPQQRVDLLVLDAVQDLGIEAVIGAIARADQVVVIADPRSAGRGAVAELAAVLPTIRLDARASRRDPELTRLLMRHGYADALRPAPVPVAEPLLHCDVVAGIGTPEPDTGIVSSTEAEVQRAVVLAIEHATNRPNETLAIVSLTAAHADRIRLALDARIKADPTLTVFFDPRRHEPVVVVDAANAVGRSRDAVLLSTGFGRTPHGRVLHRFGALAEPGGEAELLGAIGVARKRLHVLSSLRPEDLQPERMRAPGPRLLRELLELAQRRMAEPVGELTEPLVADPGPIEVDRLLLDLGERLRQQGYPVEANYGEIDGERLPLAVGHPDLPGEMLVAVGTDDATYVAEQSMRVRDRQWSERLKSLGWEVTHVWSVVAFLDPEGEAERVRRVVERAYAARSGKQGAAPRTDELPIASVTSG